jgi:hypothetical protein
MKTLHKSHERSLLTVLSATTLLGSMSVYGCGTFGSAFSLGAGLNAANVATDAATTLAGKGLRSGGPKRTISASPEAKDHLLNAKKIVVVFEKQEEGTYWYAPVGLTQVYRDAVAAELLKFGYNVVATHNDAQIASLRKQGVDLIFSCAVAPATSYGDASDLGYTGKGEWKGKVSSGSLEVRMSSQDEELVMSAVLAYKEGKNPQDVAADMAEVIRKVRGDEANDSVSTVSEAKHTHGRR